MKHILAYGNSDQASFRDEAVRNSFDYMVVPGTIAAYYQDATAAFVLSSELDYLIDPRTPLYQEFIDHPRASHYALAEALGPTVSGAMGDDGPADFPATFYSDGVIAEMVSSVLDFQRDYGERGGALRPKLDRYARLLAEALGRDAEEAPGHVPGPSPSFMLAPYFATGSSSDRWWDVNLRVWEAVRALPDRNAVSPVACVASADLLGGALAAIPAELSDAVFFWVTGFDERGAAQDVLDQMWSSVEGGRPGRRLINLYGGFFSICMTHAGLWAISNGLGYSESREWPQLTSTGAAPARYYVRDLHMYLPPAVAESLMRADDGLRCPCEACVASPSILGMGYQDLKRHFALARRWEIELAEGNDAVTLAAQLRSAHARAQAAIVGLPERTQPKTGFLTRWASTLEAS